jgi:hypothetical protein
MGYQQGQDGLGCSAFSVEYLQEQYGLGCSAFSVEYNEGLVPYCRILIFHLFEELQKIIL